MKSEQCAVLVRTSLEFVDYYHKCSSRQLHQLVGMRERESSRGFWPLLLCDKPRLRDRARPNFIVRVCVWVCALRGREAVELQTDTPCAAAFMSFLDSTTEILTM